MSHFECERRYLEAVVRPLQRNVLIAEYCNEKFEYYNLVDVYYRKFDSNAILMFLVICIAFPLLFMAISTIADKYLSVGMQDLSRRFKLSPALAATTLIAFANGAPDVLAAFSSAGKTGKPFISIGALFGAFLFASTLVVANVRFSVKEDIVLPKLAILKEALFYGSSILVVIVFAFIQSSGIPFVIVYMLIYSVYIFLTLKLDNMDKSNQSSIDVENTNMNPTSNELVVKSDDDKPDESNEGKDSDKKSLLNEIQNDLFDEEAGFSQNMILLPLTGSGLISIPYLENPLMKTPLKYVIIAISIYTINKFLELTEFSDLSVLGFGVFCSLVFWVLQTVNVSEYLLNTIFEIISVLAAIGWMKIFATFIIDFITYLAFYFSINEVVLATLLLSAGNSLGDYFGNSALAAQGETVMAGMASYSGQIFNNFVGLSANIMISALKGKSEFDIFGINSDEKDKIAGLMPASNLYILFVILFALVLIAGNILYFTTNNYTLNKKFAYGLFAYYGIFFTFSIGFALLSRK